MISGLVSADSAHFMNMVDAALAEARSDTHTMILSSEGLFHRWWDFSSAGLSALQSLVARFPLQFWLFFREPVSFARSFYIQMLKNPRGLGPCYGQDVSVSDMLDDPRFALHLDYIGYIRTVEAALGAGTVRPFHYQGDTIAGTLAALEIGDLEPSTMQENRTIGKFGVGLIRMINQRTMAVEQKWQAVRLIEELDKLVDDYKWPLALEPEVVSRIDALSADSVRAFEQRYGLAIGRAQGCRPAAADDNRQ